MLIGVFSPLAKIFQPRFEVFVPWTTEERERETRRVGEGNLPSHKTVLMTTSDLLKDPARIYTEEDFTVTVPRPVGDVKFVRGRPREIATPELRAFLGGGPEGDYIQETDFSGLAEIAMQADDLGTMAAIMGGTATPEDTAARLRFQVRSAQESAAMISHKRVDRQIRRVVQILKVQREKNKEDKRGNYEPSSVEYLCAYYLSAEDAKNDAEKREVSEKFQEMMSRIENKAAVE